MRVHVVGEGHLAEVHTAALEMWGFDTSSAAHPELVLIAEDVLDHGDEDRLQHVAQRVASCAEMNGRPQIVLLSQVPPGFARIAANYPCEIGQLVVMVDTIIVSQALDRVMRPEQIILGVQNVRQPNLGVPLQRYLRAMGKPATRIMSYASAEVAKCAINYMLGTQIAAANKLSEVAMACGADYSDVQLAMHGDARIGPHAYLRPGQTNQHLDRDINTVRAIAAALESPDDAG